MTGIIVDRGGQQPRIAAARIMMRQKGARISSQRARSELLSVLQYALSNAIEEIDGREVVEILREQVLGRAENCVEKRDRLKVHANSQAEKVGSQKLIG